MSRDRHADESSRVKDGRGSPGERDGQPVSSLRAYGLTWIALLVLLALTAGSSFIPLGAFNLVANLAIALAKALLVVFVFMHVRRGTPMIRVFAVAGLLWLALLAGLSFTDFAARFGS